MASSFVSSSANHKKRNLQPGDFDSNDKVQRTESPTRENVVSTVAERTIFSTAPTISTIGGKRKPDLSHLRIEIPKKQNTNSWEDRSSSAPSLPSEAKSQEIDSEGVNEGGSARVSIWEMRSSGDDSDDEDEVDPAKVPLPQGLEEEALLAASVPLPTDDEHFFNTPPANPMPEPEVLGLDAAFGQISLAAPASAPARPIARLEEAFAQFGVQLSHIRS